MEEDRRRALRRRHRERMIRKAYRQTAWRRSETREHPGEAMQWARHNHDHLAMCSCFMCGNPRRYAKGDERWTLQEKRGFVRERECNEYLIGRTSCRRIA